MERRQPGETGVAGVRGPGPVPALPPLRCSASLPPSAPTRRSSKDRTGEQNKAQAQCQGSAQSRGQRCWRPRAELSLQVGRPGSGCSSPRSGPIPVGPPFCSPAGLGTQQVLEEALSLGVPQGLQAAGGSHRDVPERPLRRSLRRPASRNSVARLGRGLQPQPLPVVSPVRERLEQPSP